MKRLIYKKVSKKGSLTIPAEVRRELGYQPGDAMELEVTEDHKVLVGPYILRCGVCGTDREVVDLNGHGVCRDCIRKLTEKAGEGA